MTDAARRGGTLLADLLSLPTEPLRRSSSRPPSARPPPVAALVDRLTRLAEDAAGAVLLEDVHWIDPTTQELLTRLIDRIASTRVLAVITARPEFASPWTAMPIVLLALSQAQCAEMVAGPRAGAALAPELVEEIVAKSRRRTAVRGGVDQEP